MIEERIEHDGHAVGAACPPLIVRRYVGVTAGIDFGLTLVAHLRRETAARLTQLTMEYEQKPRFDADSPEGAGPEVTALARSFIEPVHARTLQIARAWRDQREGIGGPVASSSSGC